MTGTPERESAVSVKALAALLGVSTDTVYAMAKSGEILGFKVGRVWRFFRSRVIESLADPADPWQRNSHQAARRKKPTN